jgi:tRNA nucleotidyltransferase (CCA-adding enzyme)
MNGVADIENRELRLVSNYGFIEDPARMVRAARLGARLGWHMEERTRARYDNSKDEDHIAAMSAAARGYETEEIIREEDPVRVLRRLESEGWMKHLFPAWTASKANEAELNRLRDTVGQLNAMGIYPDPSAAYFPLLTAKLAPKDVTALKKSFARPGFAEQIGSLEAETKAFGTQFMAKENAAPSAAWKLLGSAVPESVLWLAHSTKSAPIQARFKAFFSDWPQARQRIPYTLMQEMRITPDLPGYDELVEKIFFAIMDGKLDTPEAAKAFLEPFSPPAPPPPVNMRRRALKRETKPAKSRSKKVAAAVEVDEEAELDTDVAALAPPAAKAPAPKPEKTAKAGPAAPAAPAKTAAKPPPAKVAVKPVEAAKKAAKPAPAVKAKPAAAKAAAKKAPAKATAKPVAKTKSVSKPAAKKTLAKVQKPAAKAAKKPAPKVVAKKAPAKVVAKKATPAKKAAPAKKSKPQAKPVSKPKSHR